MLWGQEAQYKSPGVRRQPQAVLGGTVGKVTAGACDTVPGAGKQALARPRGREAGLSQELEETFSDSFRKMETESHRGSLEGK